MINFGLLRYVAAAQMWQPKALPLPQKVLHRLRFTPCTLFAGTSLHAEHAECINSGRMDSGYLCRLDEDCDAATAGSTPTGVWHLR